MAGQNMDDYVLNGVLLSSEWIKDVYPQYQFLIEIFHSYIYISSVELNRGYMSVGLNCSLMVFFNHSKVGQSLVETCQINIGIGI